MKRRRLSATISKARGRANLHARHPMATFFSRYFREKETIDLRVVWFSFCEKLGVEKIKAEQVWELLKVQYVSQTSRAYHDMGHIGDCLALLNIIPVSPELPTSFILALFFHDAVYDTWAKDNEERSCEFARFCMKLMGLSDSMNGRVCKLIMATKHDFESSEHDERLIADIDLYSLSLSKSEFEMNTLEIRREYGWLPAKEFIEGRVAFFKRFLAGRTSIYQTDWFRNHFEKVARINIREYISDNQ